MPRAPLPVLPLALTLLAGCQPTADYAVAHAVVPAFGPCRASMDSLEDVRGKPWKTIVGDEEDLSDDTLVSDHEWGYALRGPTGDERPDSVDVVHFRWDRDATWCEVSERRARRQTSSLLPPWSD